MRSHAILGLVLVALAVSACGNTRGERALTGGAAGAGVGAVGSAILGGSAVTGAVVGGATGAVIGAVTERDDVDLGKIID